LVVSDSRLVYRQAHSPSEEPDELGRPTRPAQFSVRPMIRVELDFVRMGAGGRLSRRPLASGDWQRITVEHVCPAGSGFALQSVSERSFSRSFIDVGSNDGIVQSDREVVSAGVKFSALAGGDSKAARLSGRVSVSSFAGDGVDRSAVEVPLSVDMPWGRWVEVSRITGASASARVAFRAFDWSISGTGDVVIIRVRVTAVEGISPREPA